MRAVSNLPRLGLVVTFFFALFFGVLFVIDSQARLDQIPGSRFTSAQVAAQGDAALGLPDDVISGLFYNPAILGKIKKPRLELINYSLSPSETLITKAGQNAGKVLSLSNARSLLSSHPQQNFGFSGRYALSYGGPNFFAGLLMQAEFSAQARLDGSIYHRSLYQFIPTVGMGRSFLKGWLRLGYSLQWVNQASGAQTASESSALSYSSGLTQGAGFSHTLGAALTVPASFFPQLDLIVRNVGGTRYSTQAFMYFVTQPVGVSPFEPMTLDAAFSVHPSLGRLGVLHLSLAYRDFTHRSALTSARERIALGSELSLSQRVLLRGGLRGRYPCFGVGFKTRSAELSLTYYSENVGESGIEMRNAQYLFQYSLRSF